MKDAKAVIKKTSYFDPFKTTIKRPLPYNFRLLVNGKIVIEKTSGQMLIVSRDQVENILQRDDLDVARRRMYEGALEAWNQAQEEVE